MKPFRLSLLSLAIVSFLLVSLIATADAQGPSYYRSVFDTWMKQWNAGKIDWQKTTFQRRFFVDLDSRMKQRPYGYETSGWKELQKASWSALLARSKSVLPIDQGAIRLLRSLYEENLDSFMRSVRMQDAPKFLEMPLFLILSTAQTEAQRRRHTKITKQDIAIATLSWWTRTYPLCSRTPPPRP